MKHTILFRNLQYIKTAHSETFFTRDWKGTEGLSY